MYSSTKKLCTGIQFLYDDDEKTSHCVTTYKCISRIRRALQKCDVIRLLIAYQNSSGLFTRSPFLNLNMFEKAHIGHK